MRIVTALSGVILIGTAIWCFAHQGTSFLALAFIIGVVMLLQSLGEVCAYISVRNEIVKSSWIITDAAATLMLGALVLVNQITVDSIIPVFFGIWLLYSGILRMVASFHMIRAGEKAWLWVLLFATLTVIAGEYCFFNGVLKDFGMITLAAQALLLQGVNILALAVNMPGKYIIFPKDAISKLMHHQQPREDIFEYKYDEETAEE